MPTPPTTNSPSSGTPECRRVLISAFFPFNINLEGVGTLVFGMARGLLAAGWRVRLLLPAGTRVPAGCEGLTSVHTYSGGVTGWLAYLRALRRHARPGETVLWVENNPNLAWLGSLALGAARGCWYFYTPLQPVSLVARLGWWRLQAVAHALTKNALWSRLQNWRHRRCMVATRHQARQLERFHPVVVQVHPGVPLPADWCRVSRDEARRQLGWDDRPVAGYLGHFAPAKGVPLLLRAFARLLAEDATSGSVLALAHSGRGRLAAADETCLNALRGTGRLREIGVTDPALFLAACDCVVLPYPSGSIHHPPLVLIEAYAAATAVVTTDVGGLAELVLPGETGALVPPGDEDALAAAIRRLLADLPACHAQGRRGQTLFQTRLSQTPFCAAVADFLRQEERR